MGRKKKSLKSQEKKYTVDITRFIVSCIKTFIKIDKKSIKIYITVANALQWDHCYRGHPDKVNQSQSRRETINSTSFSFEISLFCS